MRVPLFLCGAMMLVLEGCGNSQAPASASVVPFVKTEQVLPDSDAVLGLSGVVRARVESPLAFQVSGRILARKVDAGARVAAGEVLFELDRRDLQQALRAAEATLSAAESGLDASEAELVRSRRLQARQFISLQALQAVEDAAHQARGRRDAARALLNQARNAFDYGQLRAPAAGVLLEVSGEVGQVVSAGQAIAVLAQAGQPEVEVHFPENLVPPDSGEILLAEGPRPLTLRERAGAVDAASGTLRVRYAFVGPATQLALGSVVRTRFHRASASTESFSIPLSALSERGQGARVWLYGGGQVHSVPVSVLQIDDERARVSGALRVGDRLIALGVHLLNENMQVRELPR
ncbi:efflux RND transporter periplasmic adaptor subunit [Pseudomonas sp. NBRC 100443]|uniref:efflux RND transporter periplasmic adaptor subunit n=1 Tax=Pseudomonas sp. NBRC 100443 TaxID=1113665 RepID=UPI0024A24953|nr:efflux RND transporter periplasmic adaptor subunit [Pseudomonas sp. NBRC 100443]GLU39235.1 hemolysin secretion protein D [Pseudomonas sp. NBRC 100443]